MKVAGYALKNIFVGDIHFCTKKFLKFHFFTSSSQLLRKQKNRNHVLRVRTETYRLCLRSLKHSTPLYIYIIYIYIYIYIYTERKYAILEKFIPNVQFLTFDFLISSTSISSHGLRHKLPRGWRLNIKNLRSDTFEEVRLEYFIISLPKVLLKNASQLEDSIQYSSMTFQILDDFELYLWAQSVKISGNKFH